MQARSSDSINLDLLRSIAVLCVYANHLWDSVRNGGTITSWHIGQLGVSIFFVHTTLVLMWSAERLRHNGWPLAYTFYVRRAFRIYPLSLVCVLGVYFLFPHRWGLTALLTNLTLTQNLFYQTNIVGPLWSLAVEAQMYLVLPLAFFFCRRRSAAAAFGLWAVSVPLAILQNAVSPRLQVLSYAPNFLGGVVAWKLINHGVTKRFPSWTWPLAIPAVSTIWMISDRQHNMWYRWLFGLALGLVIPLFADITWKWLTRVSQSIAKYSYGIYLTHTTVIWFAFTYLAGYNGIVRWTTLAVLSAAVPIALYHLIEAPMIKLSKRCFSDRAFAPGLQESPMTMVSEPVLP